MAILSSKCHGIAARGPLITPQSKNGSSIEEPFADFLLSHTLHLHAALEDAQAHGDEEGHDEVVDRYDDERWEWLEADALNGGRRIHQIGHTDDRDLRGLFDEGDEFIPDDGQDVADRLRDDDAHHRLPLREAKRHRTFELSLRDGLDTRANAPEFRISARTPAESLSKSTPMIWKLGKWMPRNGSPKNTREICTKTGVPRMTST